MARWRRRPAVWLIGVLLVWALISWDDHSLAANEVNFAGSPIVTATIDGRIRWWQTVDVSFVDPASGRTVHDTIDVYDMSRFPADDDRTIAIELAPGTEREARIAGDVLTYSFDWSWIGLVAPAVVWWLLRVRHIRAVRGLMASTAPTFRMSGEVVVGRRGRGARLALSPLDASSASQPVCTVRLIDGSRTRGPHAIDVKGAPRPFGALVARSCDDGEVWWPAGRALGWTPGRAMRRP